MKTQHIIQQKKKLKKKKTQITVRENRNYLRFLSSLVCKLRALHQGTYPNDAVPSNYSSGGGGGGRGDSLSVSLSIRYLSGSLLSSLDQVSLRRFLFVCLFCLVCFLFSCFFLSLFSVFFSLFHFFSFLTFLLL